MKNLSAHLMLVMFIFFLTGQFALLETAKAKDFEAISEIELPFAFSSFFPTNSGTYLFVADETGRGYNFEIPALRQIKAFSIEKAPGFFADAAFSQDGSQMILRSGYQIQLWNTKDGKLLSSCFSPDKGMVAFLDSEHVITSVRTSSNWGSIDFQEIDCVQNKVIRTIPGIQSANNNYITELIVSPNKKLALTIDYQGISSQILDLEHGTVISHVTSDINWARFPHASFISNEEYVIAHDQLILNEFISTLDFYEVKSGKLMQSINLGYGKSTSIGVSSDNYTVAVALYHKGWGAQEIVFVDGRTHQIKKRINYGNQGDMLFVKPLSDNRWIINTSPEFHSVHQKLALIRTEK